MLVVTANWAFPDGTIVGPRGRPRLAREWLRTLRRGVIRGSFGRDGAYRPPPAVDVVLAGDTFEGLLSTAWAGRERPWRSGPRVTEARRGVMVGCAHRAAPLLAGLARLARRGLDLPAGDRRGRPSTVTTARVPVRVALVVGDRDRHLAEMAADVAARGAVAAPAWSDGTVLVRHGHEFDPACVGADPPPGGDRPPTLAESLAVDLVARFTIGLDAAAARGPARGALVEALAGAAPGVLPAVVTSWVAAVGAGGAGDVAEGREVATAWRRAVEGWVRAARHDPPDCGLAASPVESLAAWFVSGGTSPAPTSVAALLDRHPPSTIGAEGSVRSVVLGHPVQPPDPSAVICLGRPPVRRWCPTAVVPADGAADVACVAAGPVAGCPPTVAWHRDGDAVAWRWIAGPAGAEARVATRATMIVDAA